MSNILPELSPSQVEGTENDEPKSSTSRPPKLTIPQPPISWPFGYRIPAAANNTDLYESPLRRPKKTLISFLTYKEPAPKSIFRDRAPTPVDTSTLPWNELRDRLLDLANRALKKGYRQPLNFCDENNGLQILDDWKDEVQDSFYKYEGPILPVDVGNPVDIITSNQGLVRYHMWYNVWVRIKIDYLDESLLPDLRAVHMHKAKTYGIISLIEEEIETLEFERNRFRIYTDSQLDMIRKGISDRKIWCEDMMSCLTYMDTFHKILREFPVDAMYGRKWFGNFRPDYRDILPVDPTYEM